MKRMVIAVLVVLCMLSGMTPVLAAPVLEPYTYVFDFENGSVGAWSSYPPSQDTAYDPTIWVKPLYADKKAQNRALYREITPNFEIDTMFGVRKKLDLYVDASSVLTFKCFIKSNRDIGGVRVRFGFADGTMVERTISFSARSTWRDCAIKMSDVISGGSMQKLAAVAFMAFCPNADPENLLRFGVDDVKINGMRESAWKFSSPAVHKLDEWPEYIAGKHFTEGESITISGNPPFNVGSAAVIVSQALTGEITGTFRMKKTDSDWSVSIPLTPGTGITSGMWRVTVKASSKDKKDDTISTDLVFLVRRADAPKTNPRLLMKPGDAPKILDKASSGRMREIWESLQQNASRTRGARKPEEFKYNLDAYDDIYWLPTYGGYIQAISTPSTYIRANGIVYGISGDAEAGDAACRALLMMAKWPSFVHPHILNQGQFTYWPVGQKLADLAIGFDMVCARFTPEERREVADALYSKGVTEVFKEYVRDNRVSSNTSNWIGDVTGGGLLCALAVMNDFKDEDMEPYMTGMLLKLNALIQSIDRDGDYGEGYSYLNHAMHCINVALPALDNTFGIKFPEKLAQSYKFLLYQMDSSTKELYDYGDTVDRLSSMSVFSYLISRYHDPRLKWLYDLAPGRSDVDLLLMDDSVPSQGPEGLPTSVLFRDTGTAVLRSGFGHEDFMVVFRCGAFFNHQHFDQGAFYLSDRGENFLTEVGRSDYYDDPWYQKLVIQPAGHNCILVDRNPESQRHGDLLDDVPAWTNAASVTDFMTFDDGAFVSGRLDPIYRGKLTTLRRNILYCAPRTIVLIDEAVGAGDAREINLRFHAPRKEDITVSGKDASITRADKTLTIRTVSPAGYTSEILKRPPTIYEFGREDAVTMKTRGFLQLSADLGKEATTFVNVLTTDAGVVGGLNERSYGDHVTLSLGNVAYSINTTAGKQYSADGITTDALVYATLSDGFKAMRATKVVSGAGTLLSATAPVSVVVRPGRIVYAAPARTDVTLRLDAKPGQVRLDGKLTKDWNYDKKAGLKLKLSPGSGVIEIQ
ncbi:heparinase II/III-family protein [bacterium]|nr:heparinase II/III-family protein [bacterium]